MNERINYDQIAAQYARNRQVHPRVLECLCTPIEQHAAVLEIGCGTGNYITAIQDHTGCTCWGVEPSSGMLDKARTRSQTIHWRQGSAEKLGLPDQMFDLAFSVDVIHHVTDRPAHLREAYRVLKPGGKLCTVTDSEWIIRHRQPLTTYFPETVEKELQRYPRVAALRKMMIDAGFDETTENTVEYPYLLESLQPFREKAFSALHLISPQAFQRGLVRMEHDLQLGPIPCVSRYTMVWGIKEHT